MGQTQLIEELTRRFEADASLAAGGGGEPRSIPEIVEAAERLKSTHRSERLSASALTSSLERHPETRARLLIDNHESYQTWGLAETLMGRAQRAIYDAEPTRAVRLARLAASTADRVDPSVYGTSLTNDLRTHAWAALGNAYRCAGQFKNSRAAFDRADELLADGTGDPIEEASLLSYRASLEIDLGAYDQAINLLDESIRIYREIEDDQLLGRAMVQKSLAAGFLDPVVGTELAHQALELIDGEEDPRLFLCARHNLIMWLNDCDQAEQALMILEGSRGLYRSMDSAWWNLRLGWMEGRILASLDRLDEADAAFSFLLSEMVHRDLSLESVLVTLDLAACRLAQGEIRDAQELIAAMTEKLRAWGVHHRAREAWTLLQQQVLEESRATAIIDKLREVGLYIQRSWKNPKLTFEAQV